MKKKLLKKIPIINVKNEWIKLLKQLDHTNIKYLVAVEEKLIEDESIIILNFFDKSSSENVTYRVFISKKDYLTQDFAFSPVKWRSGCLQNALGWHWYSYCILADDSSLKILENFFNKRGISLEEIDNLQQKIMDSRLSKRHQVIKDKIDNKMKDVPRLPKGFKKWLNDTALYDSRYIYYNYKARKVLDGYCTHCKSDVKVEGARHNKKGICPKCKSPITFKAMGKSKNIIDYGQVALFQKVGSELLVRYFAVTKYYQDNYRNPKLTYTELARDFYNKDGKIESYEWTKFKQTDEIRWCNSLSRYLFYDTVLYEKNLDEALRETIWEYSAIKEYATHKIGFKFPVYLYLEKYKRYPVIEYLVKLKLFKLTDEVISYYYPYYMDDYLNFKGKNLFEVLNIDKIQLAIAQRINAGFAELKVIRETGKANLKLSDKQILFIADNIRVERIIDISKYTTVHKMFKYVNSQCSKDRSIDYTFSDWQDYIRDCNILKYDLKNEFVLFPKNLTKAHEETHKLVEENKNQLFDSMITEMYNDLFELFHWKYKDNVIVIPKSSDDIIREGQLQHHCVGSYVESVAKGRSIILFLRKENEINEPFYTIELDPSKYEIKQCRGKNNESTNKDIDEIISRFKNEKLNPLSYKQAI